MSPAELTFAVLPAAIALILLAAGAAKLADLAGFAATLAGLGTPQRWSIPAARSIAVTEAGLGALGLAGFARTPVTIATFALTLGFVAVTAAAARWRPQVRCRCFGALAGARFNRGTLARSIALALASGLTLTQLGTGRLPEHPAWAGILLLALAALFALCCTAAAKAVDLVRAGGTHS